MTFEDWARLVVMSSFWTVVIALLVVGAVKVARYPAQQDRPRTTAAPPLRAAPAPAEVRGRPAATFLTGTPERTPRRVARS